MPRVCFAAVMLAFLATPSFANSVAAWTMRPEESIITITATQQKAAFTAVFSRFQSQIAFDPEDLAHSSVVATIEMASWDSKSSQRDPAVVGADWFDVVRFPIAKFETKSFKGSGVGKYEAIADLTIRDVTRQVSFPFTLDIDGDVARMEGSLTVNRSDFGVGQGDWAMSDWVGQAVKIDVRLVADRVR